mmetsp:Transcript_31691/g.72796  ORF Transcript_31691/g.72796 Transcript_31691/m.72796 type:complete len:174 (-) Transcript_31691:1325-1846(-)
MYPQGVRRTERLGFGEGEMNSDCSIDNQNIPPPGHKQQPHNPCYEMESQRAEIPMPQGDDGSPRVHIKPRNHSPSPSKRRLQRRGALFCNQDTKHAIAFVMGVAELDEDYVAPKRRRTEERSKPTRQQHDGKHPPGLEDSVVGETRRILESMKIEQGSELPFTVKRHIYSPQA